MKASLAATLAALVLTGAAASAAQATAVSVRVEGAASTLLETSIDTTAHTVDGGDGTGPHPCRGAIGEAPGPTVTGALDDALRAAGSSWRGQWSDSSGDFLVTSVAGEGATTSGPWTILLNGAPTPVGGCSMKVVQGDRVLFARDVVFATKTLGLSGPAEAQPGTPFSLLVEDERAGGAPVAGAAVRGGPEAGGGEGESAIAGADGLATLSLEEAGRYRFKATHPDGIRSNSIEICIGVAGCEDSRGPAVRIVGIPDGARYMRRATPRSLRGTSGRGERLRLALRFRGYRGRCKAWNATRERLVRRGCRSKPHWFPVPVSDRAWSLVTGSLAPGRYRLLARATGAVKGAEDRVSFAVRAKRLNQVPLIRGASRFLARQARNRDVRRSGLLAAWTAIALSARRNQAAGRLFGPLIKGPFRRWRTADLARNLAAATMIRKGRPRIPGARKRLRAMRRNLVARRSFDGSYDQDLNLTAMAILALPGSSAAVRAAGWLSGRQDPSGGFGAAVGAPPDVDTSGLVSWALAQEGFKEEVEAAAAFVRSTQNPDGGFAAATGGSSNAQSTGLGLIALRLAGGGRLGPPTAEGITPTHYLAALRRRSGSIDYVPGTRSSAAWVTAQAVLGLSVSSGR